MCMAQVYIETPSDQQPKGVTLELGLIQHLRLNKGKGVWGFWAGEASYGQVSRKYGKHVLFCKVCYADLSGCLLHS